MSFQTDFRHHLLQDSTVSTAVDERVQPISSTDTNYPQIITFGETGVSRAYFGGTKGVKEASMRLELYTRDYVGGVDVVEAIVDRYTNFSGTMGPDRDTTVSYSTVETVVETTDSTDATLYRFIVEIHFQIT